MRKGNFMQTLKLIISLVASLFVASLILANPWMLQQKFAISYLGYQSPEIHLILLLLATLTIGVLIAILSMLTGQLRLKSTIREQKKKIRQVEEELNSLRNLPLRENSHERNNTDQETETGLVDF